MTIHTHWFQSHLDIVFFIYGLAFVIMGILILAQSKKKSVFRIGGIFWLLACFGLLHGINEWLDMWNIIRGQNDLLDIARWCCLVFSYLFLFEFGRRLFRMNITKAGPLYKKFSPFLAWPVTITITGVIVVSACLWNDFFLSGSILARYFLGLTGSLLTASGFYLYLKSEEAVLASQNVRRYFLWTIFAFMTYGILGGFIVPKGNFFPSNIINGDAFLSFTGAPVQVFRAIVAVLATWSVINILKIFDWEKKRNIEEAFEEITENYRTQEVINNILKISLEPSSFYEQMKRILDQILSISRISLQSKGCILLSDEDSGELRLAAHRNFTKSQIETCSVIPYGKCLCGLVANTKEILFSDHCEDERHEILYPDIQPHGHYCIPISSNSRLLGVINVYIQQGHRRDKREEEVLTSIANTVAGIVMRRKAQDTIRQNYNIQSVISAILQTSLLPIALKEHLEKTLDIISTIPWLSEKSTGCIFLLEDDPDVLIMKTHRRIPAQLLKTCSRLPLGRCLCGRAASTGEIVFADSLDDRHDIEYEGMHNHGHYCIPIKSKGRVLGVINLYVKEGYKRNEFEDRVFTAIADTLAGIIERKRTEERLEYMANYDILTGLPNRVLFLDRLTQEIKRARRFNYNLAILYIDLDRFKCINDTFGHDSGDMLLRSTAARIAECVRESDTVSRMSGDEFTLILSNLQDKKDVESISEKIITKLSLPYELYEANCSVTPSIGISLYPTDGEDMDTLLKNADMAMYNAKKYGGNTWLYYRPDMNDSINERREMESDLRRAIDNNEFLLHYQPQIDIKTGRIVGVEALIRWLHPKRGLIYPGEFISIAEDCGLIVPMGERILRTACEQNADWQKTGVAPLNMAVNLSLRQLYTQHNLVEMVSQILFETELQPECLEIEITESFCMQNIGSTVSMLREFKAMGIQLAIDDFGTGYSSLSYLKLLPFKKLKIDRSFVNDIMHDPDDLTIVKTIITMAHSLRLKVIAEGVETREQLELLRSLDCDEAQGYLFSKPIPSEECTDLLKNRDFKGVGLKGDVYYN